MGFYNTVEKRQGVDVRDFDWLSIYHGTENIEKQINDIKSIIIYSHAFQAYKANKLC